MQNVRKLYSKVYSICENLVLKFKQSQAVQGIWKILVSFRPSAPIKKHPQGCFLFLRKACRKRTGGSEREVGENEY